MVKLILGLSACLLGFLTCLNVRGTIQVGMKRPDFVLYDSENKQRSIAEFDGSYVVLYFFPKSGTPGCTKQACQVRDSFEDFEKNKVVVLGASYDSVTRLKKFKEEHNLPFILLSDENHKVAKLYGATSLLYFVPRRTTIVINPNGIICGIIPNAEPATHVKDIMQIIMNDLNKK